MRPTQQDGVARIRTARLEIVPVDVEIARAELRDPAAFAALLSATVPDNWPPDMLSDARALFLDLLEAGPGRTGWLGWYALWQYEEDAAPVLVGGAGFLGPPDANGRVELGYSILPQFYGMGFATEMAGAVIEWARSHADVRDIVAQTAGDNLSSRKVLAKLGFDEVGPGDEPSSVSFLQRPPHHPAV